MLRFREISPSIADNSVLRFREISPSIAVSRLRSRITLPIIRHPETPDEATIGRELLELGEPPYSQLVSAEDTQLLVDAG